MAGSVEASSCDSHSMSSSHIYTNIYIYIYIICYIYYKYAVAGIPCARSRRSSYSVWKIYISNYIIIVYVYISLPLAARSACNQACIMNIYIYSQKI